ncbi:MAG: hypothetical protein LUJ09_04150 [Firmicutes bacterium]|nr:hypothetical protein [Bacillota bacterium]
MRRTSKPEPEYRIVADYISEQGNYITIRRPVLTEEERARRMQQIDRAASNLILALEREKAHAAGGGGHG